MRIPTSLRPRRIGAIAVVAAMSAVGLAAAPPANATWSVLFQDVHDNAFVACKTATSSSAYGPLWQVKLVATSSRLSSIRATFQVTRNGSTVNTTELSASSGVWDVKTTYASRWYTDRYQLTGSAGVDRMGGVVRASGRVKDLATC
ncbi:hypothetical protein JQN72_14610 [Phycicoccus sp. CSK15P-2]|uniref:hypothetical protein n=1 Tax=Phycicoccus sp. CSK15P-2 TaxID=2807627 RepID=UPI00194F76F7|nr:hypothetical protein [Phycicoccus sp. CSK15P-2]MBM6405475.1 hypothetical protein [Phycicoccus sp. CSK15P-2]